MQCANPYHAILNRTFERRTPLTVHWELTYQCNLNCRHCYAVRRDPAGELGLTEIEHVMDDLAGMGCLFLTLTGGEIFCRPDIAEILALTRRKRFALHLFTNGTLLTPAMLDHVCAANPVGVEISLYAMIPALHDDITGVCGSQAQAASAIRECRRRGLSVTVKMMLMRDNVHEYPAVRDFARAAGVGCKFDFALVPADDGAPRMAQYGMSEDELAEFARQYGDPARPPAPAPDPAAPLCGAGFNVMCINPAGDVYPCLAIRRAVGNVRRRPLSEIWGGAALDFVRNARQGDVSACRACPDAGYCTRCAGVALAETGDLLAASPSACLAARATRRALRCLSRD